ncbi:hypothetical protein V1318_00535 [Lysobacter sp. CCNWLW3]|uniref:hypothetical protein n=1 Tax=unclassified Lysobacter TaxID=2635362 RepID=UPI002FD00691
MRFGALLALSLAYAFSGNAHAGSAPAELKCTPLTQGSSMQLDGTIPASEEVLSLVVSSREHRYTLSDEGSQTTLIESLTEGVFALQIRSDGFETTLYALPSTVKATRLPYGIRASFVAKLTALRPSRHKSAGAAYAYDDYVRDIKLSCEYRYEI